MIAWWIWVLIGVGVCAAAGLAFAIFRYRPRDIGVAAQRQDRRIIINLDESFYFSKVSDDHLRDLIVKLTRDEAADRAAREAVKTGLLLDNIPVTMVQGNKQRVEVKIARSAAFRDAMLSGLRGEGEPQFEEIPTSLYMEVKLAAPTFEVIDHSPSEQLIIPTPACWEFDVLPTRAGQRQITLNVSMRIEAEGIKGGRRGVSVLEKHIDVEVNLPYATGRFVAGNWQWLIPTVLALAGAVAAWLVVPF